MDDAIEREIEQYGTLVHGDVKGANIVFNRDVHPHRVRSKKSKAPSAMADDAPLQCALYDLQYVGLGLPTLDLVYFLATSVESKLLTPQSERELLETYHASLLRFISKSAGHNTYTIETLWKHWELAIVDWFRFMAGWGFWGNDAWVRRRAREIVSQWESDGLAAEI